MFLTKLKTLVIVVLVFGLATFSGSGLLICSTTAAQGEQKEILKIADKPKELSNPPKKESVSNASKGNDEQLRKDLFGDPLPPHALTRLGTLRLRHGDSIRNLGFSPDGKSLLSADAYGVHFWDVATGKHLRKLGDPKDNWQFQHVVASADNRFVAISVSKGDIEIWDATAGRVLRTLKTGQFPGLALSPNGRILVVLDIGTGRAGEKRNLRLFDTTSNSR